MTIDTTATLQRMKEVPPESLRMIVDNRVILKSSDHNLLPVDELLNSIEPQYLKRSLKQMVKNRTTTTIGGKPVTYTWVLKADRDLIAMRYSLQRRIEQLLMMRHTNDEGKWSGSDYFNPKFPVFEVIKKLLIGAQVSFNYLPSTEQLKVDGRYFIDYKAFNMMARCQAKVGSIYMDITDVKES